MIHTEICDLLGIEYPIFQGGMAWVSDASLAGAVSNAGGLGIIAGMNSNGEQLREQIRKIREITNKPYGVNVMLMSPYADEVAQVVVEEKVPVVVTGAGLPSKYIKTWVENGLKVVPVVPSVAIARMCERMGACAVVAEGGESGGHVGDLTTMALTPQVVDAVKIPVLAAGGIGDGRGVAAALMLGAKGVQVGTRFLVATECTIHENYKQRVLKAKDIDTIVNAYFRLAKKMYRKNLHFFRKPKTVELTDSSMVIRIDGETYDFGFIPHNDLRGTGWKMDIEVLYSTDKMRGIVQERLSEKVAREL